MGYCVWRTYDQRNAVFARSIPALTKEHNHWMHVRVGTLSNDPELLIQLKCGMEPLGFEFNEEASDLQHDQIVQFDRNSFLRRRNQDHFWA